MSSGMRTNTTSNSKASHFNSNYQQQQQQQSNAVLPRNISEAVVKHCDALISSTSVREALEASRLINRMLGCGSGTDADYGIKNFFKLRTVLNANILAKWNRVSSILKTLDDKANRKEYVQARARLMGRKVLVIGGGLAGLRACIELLLLGAQVICVEKRDEFSRNNVIHLWPNVINDMISFEAKRFYGKFCVGSIDHISIRQLQMILLKIALIYGVRFVPGVTFAELCVRLTEPKQYDCDKATCDCCCHRHGFGDGAHAHFQSNDVDQQELVAYLNRQPFDVIIGCDGRRHTFAKYFPRNSRRGKLAIGLTANYVNKRSEEEVHCAEISGRSRIYHRDWFKGLEEEKGIELENLVYYRDDTHYFVMTATKLSLLKRGVLKSDYPDSHQLLDTNNIDIRCLMRYSKDTAEWSSKLRNLEFALNSNNRPDVALFDFTAMYSAMNASCAKRIYRQCCSAHCQEETKYVLIMLCGDSLLEPFWPTGSGAGRGFLSAMDAAWTVAQWCNTVSDEVKDIDGMLDVISKREYIYRLLAQTTPENTTAKGFGLDPQTRYKNVNFGRNNQTLREIKEQVRHLIIDKAEVNKKKYTTSYETKRSRRATVDINVEDVARAKAINSRNSFNAFDFEEYGGYRGRTVARPRNSTNLDSLEVGNSSSGSYQSPSNSVPSPATSHAFNTNARNTTTSSSANLTNCDSLEVFEYKPRNATDAEGYLPRNSPVSSEFGEYYEYRARNADDERVNERPTSDYRPSNNNSNNGVYDRNGHNLLSHSTTKLDDYLNSKTELNDYSRLLNPPAQQKPTAAEQARRSYLEERRNFLLREFKDTRPEDQQQQYQRNKPKKSSDIMEKAMNLEQKFEDTFKKPFEPKLAKVGKIEEEDWNVKMWNSTDAFAPKVKDKVNIVYDNSKELLQSRIQQLSNNMTAPSVANTANLVPKNRAPTNEYVNLMQSEISQKFGKASTTTTRNETKVKPSTSSYTPASVPIDSSLDLLRLSASISSSKEAPSTTNATPSLKSLELLRSLGTCKRCGKSVGAIDKAMVKGECYHKTCLTCKTCYVGLRIDELDTDNDDFICKLCRSRRDFTRLADARNNFFSSSLNLSMIEAKKNFLVNVDQIDFRERAEFVIDEPTEDEQKVEPEESLQQTSTVEEGEEAETTTEEQPMAVEEDVENNNVDDDDVVVSEASSSYQSTSSTGSDGANTGENNYTDDERSESSDGDGTDKKRKDSIDSNRDASSNNALASCLTLPVKEEMTEKERAALLMTTSMFARLDLPTIDGEAVEPEDTRDTPPSPAPAFAQDVNKFVAFNDSLNGKDEEGEVFQSLPVVATSNGQASPLLYSSLGLVTNNTSLVDSFGATEAPKVTTCKLGTTGKTTTSTTAIAEPIVVATELKKTTTAPVFKYPRYGGQFTEKFYRAQSQPSLFEQMNKLDEKLKKRYPLMGSGHSITRDHQLTAVPTKTSK